MLTQLRSSILPFLAVIYGIAINALYLRLFAEYFDSDIFSNVGNSNAFGLELGHFSALLFLILTVLIIAAIGALSDYWGRKTILIFTATLSLGLLAACLIILNSVVDISQADWMLSFAWILIFVIYCSELAVALCYLLENTNNNKRVMYASLILFAVFLDPLTFLICSMMVLVLGGATKGFNLLRPRFFPNLATPIIWPNLSLYLDYSVLFISIYFVSNVMLPSLIDIKYLMLLMPMLSLFLPFARWALLKNDKKIYKTLDIRLNQIAPIAEDKPLKLLLSFIGVMQFVVILQFFMSAVLLYVLNQLGGFAANILSQFVNFAVPFSALSLGIIADQMGRKWILRYSGGVSIAFVIFILSYCSLSAFTLNDQVSFFITIMVFLAWLILGGAALAGIPIVFIAENCSRQRRGLFVSIIIAIYFCLQFSTPFAAAQLWLSSVFLSLPLLLGIVFFISAIIGFISLKPMQETAFIPTENL